MKIEEIEKFGKKASGQRFLPEYLEGKYLTKWDFLFPPYKNIKKEEIFIQCHDCTCRHKGEMNAYDMQTYPLYDWRPYNKNKMSKKK